MIEVALHMVCLWMGEILQIKPHLSLHQRQITALIQESLMNILNSWDNPGYSKLLTHSQATVPKSLMTK